MSCFLKIAIAHIAAITRVIAPIAVAVTTSFEVANSDVAKAEL